MLDTEFLLCTWNEANNMSWNDWAGSNVKWNEVKNHGGSDLENIPTNDTIMSAMRIKINPPSSRVSSVHAAIWKKIN